MKPDAAAHYHECMQRVITHIDANVDGDLSIEVLSAIAGFSKFHFHRQFTELFGQTIHTYIQLTRMKRASYILAFRDTPVTQVALDSGYETVESFSRAFKQTTGQSPSAFRKNPGPYPWSQPIDIRSNDMNTDVQIVDFPETRVAMLTHRGDPKNIAETIRDFIAWRKDNKLPPPASKTYNILHTDPQTTAPEDYRMDLCCTTDKPVEPNEQNVIASTIPAGRCAVLRHTGDGHNLRPSAHYLYAEWLPNSNEQLRDFPLFAHRVAFFPDEPEQRSIVDLYLPLK